MDDDLASNITEVRERIARAAERVGRSPGEITLIAVTKTHPVDRILQAIEAGLTNFGENRVQEAIAKYSAGNDDADQVPRNGITLHMIGTLQRNKAKLAARHFDRIHSVDRVELVRDLDEAAGRERSDRPLPVLLEVNLSGEASKSGVPAEELPNLAEALEGCTSLLGIGLMTIARFGAGEKELRETFAGLRDLLAVVKANYSGDWRHLSMGMSDDYEYAIEEGATMVRVGRALFGERLRLG